MILVVDDDAAILKHISGVLDSVCCKYRAFDAAVNAMRSASQVQYQGAILDAFMPGMNGDELARQLRTAHPDLPVLFYSGLSDDFNKQHLRSLGYYLSKQAAVRDQVTVLLEFVNQCRG